jgi:hypothetical protein
MVKYTSESALNIKETHEKNILKLHAVGPHGERMLHAVGQAASVKGGPRGSPPCSMDAEIQIKLNKSRKTRKDC